jgi:hypothetical protein
VAENQNFFTKKKTEKKESTSKGGGAKNPKGNGISPEGWQEGKKINSAKHLICLAIMP